MDIKKLNEELTKLVEIEVDPISSNTDIQIAKDIKNKVSYFFAIYNDTSNDIVSLADADIILPCTDDVVIKEMMMDLLKDYKYAYFRLENNDVVFSGANF